MSERALDTSMGGAAGGFPDTTWGLVSRLRDSDPAERRPGIDKLARRYWKPVYACVRATWGKERERSQDLTQSFFLWLLEGETLAKYAPERGSFRGYLKGVLRRFLADEGKAAARLKRGGGVTLFPLDDDLRSWEESLADPRTPDPERAFDQTWKREVLDAALERVRAHYSGERAVPWRAFEAYELAAGDPRPTYAEVAARLGIKESDVRNHLFAVRERLRTEVRAELQDTVADPAQLQEEWLALFA